MTTLRNRVNAALLVIDVQEGVVRHAHARDAVIANLRALVSRARAEQIPVIWVQHSSGELPTGSDAWKIVAELAPAATEPIVHKNYGDAFEATELETVLATLGVGALFIAGAQSDACIRATLHGAFVRGYDVFLVADAHTTEDRTAWGVPPPDQIVAFTNLYWKYETAPGRTAGVVAAGDVDFARTAASLSR